MTYLDHNARAAVMAGFYTILGVICLLKGATSREFFGRDLGFTGELRKIPAWRGRVFFIGIGALSLGSGIYLVIKLLGGVR